MSTTGKAVCVVYLAYSVKLSQHKRELFSHAPGDGKNLHSAQYITSHVYDKRIEYRNLNQQLNF